MTKSDTLLQARKEILINKDYKKAILILNEVKDISDLKLFNHTLAFVYLESGEYKHAAEIYKKINEKYHAGFCELLTGNEEEAKRLWDSALDSPACRWGKCLLDYIKGRRGPVPTYLQIRNHLETDLGYFIHANKTRYAENLMRCDDIFISINLESYKLIGRVLLGYGFFNMAKKYFMKSIGILPEDPENFYYLGLYNYQTGAYKDSQRAFERCLEYNPNHTPARKLLGKVDIKLNS